MSNKVFLLRLFADNAVEDVEKLKILSLIACCILNVDGYTRSVTDVRTQSNIV